MKNAYRIYNYGDGSLIHLLVPSGIKANGGQRWKNEKTSRLHPDDLRAYITQKATIEQLGEKYFGGN